jgi:predicted site-specific integrase-resolvase
MCICTKDYNKKQKVEALNRKVKQIAVEEVATKSTKELSDISVCRYSEFPARECTDRTCTLCGTHRIQEYLQPIITNSNKDEVIKYHQWETRCENYTNREVTSKKVTRWIQVEKKQSTEDIIKDISESMESFTAHMFRANYQHKVQANLTANLEINHCLVVMDYSENMTLQPQDEIESAHWTQKQVTLFPIHIVCHAADSTKDKPLIVKESLIILSDGLAHNAGAVYVFTDQLLFHLENSHGLPVKVLRRFSDNCAAQFKCKDAFCHLFLLETKRDVKIHFHYTESDHGKGPSDGLGAGVKKKLERMMLSGKVINNAYQAYLTLRQSQTSNRQHVMYIRKKKINHEAPKRNKNIKPITGTQSFHMVRTLPAVQNILLCRDLSCSCSVCIQDQNGPCLYGKYRHKDVLWNISEGHTISTEQICTSENNASTCILSCLYMFLY